MQIMRRRRSIIHGVTGVVALCFACESRALLPADLGEIEAREIIRERHRQQSQLTPEEFEARLAEEREARNDELKAQTQLPPVGFEHFDSPPSAAIRELQASRARQSRESVVATNRGLDFINSTLLAGALLLLVLLYHLVSVRRDGDEQSSAVTGARSPLR